MAPNIIGSTFILAETAISDANNNKIAATTNNGSTAANAANKVVAKPAQTLLNQQLNNNNKAEVVTDSDKELKPYKMQIVWYNVFLFVVLHSMALYGVYLLIAERAILEMVIVYLTAVFGGLGITAGVHRLWSHKAYKAKLPLRIFLMLCQSLAFQNSIWEWTRDHRVHHKFTDTNADPHNSKRGFFFAHMGWLMCKKHPDVTSKGKQIDLSDIEADPVVMFQKKYYYIIMPICCFVLPALIPYLYMGTSLRVCFFVCSMLRYTLSLHATWLVNSAAHFYGMKPYDINVSARNTKFVSALTFGEGWHNYHHVFPWDYKAAELGTYNYNWTTGFIDFMAKIGQAYDLKSVSDDMILKRVQRTGDGSHISVLLDANNNNTAAMANELIAHLDHEQEEVAIWGWDDKDIKEDDRLSANIVAKKDD